MPWQASWALLAGLLLGAAAALLISPRLNWGGDQGGGRRDGPAAVRVSPNPQPLELPADKAKDTLTDKGSEVPLPPLKQEEEWLVEHSAVAVPVSRPPPVRLLCWVPVKDKTDPEIKFISETWAHDCDRMIFFSEIADNKLGIVSYNYKMSEHFDLWNAVHRSWAILYMYLLNEYDWFVKLDSDSFLLGNNFKAFVSNLNASQPHYTGHITFHKKPDLLALGACIAVSRGALAAIGPSLPTTPHNVSKCEAKVAWSEDWQFYKCLKKNNVHKATLGFDRFGRERFFIRPITQELFDARDISWLWNGKPSTAGDRLRCCNSRPAAFHYLKVSHGMGYYHSWARYFFQLLQVDPVILRSASASKP